MTVTYLPTATTPDPDLAAAPLLEAVHSLIVVTSSKSLRPLLLVACVACVVKDSSLLGDACPSA